MPRVAILIPVYNRPALVAAAIESALGQTIRDIEVIVSDNCSDDGTWEVVARFARDHSRVRALRQSHNRGPVENWRACARAATAPLSALLFSDDVYAPTFLEALAPLMDEPEVGFAYSSARWRADDEQVVRYRALRAGLHPSRDYLRKVLCGTDPAAVPVSPGCAIFRTHDLVDALHTRWSDDGLGYMRHGAGPDLWTYMHVASLYPKIAHISEPLVEFLSHKDNLSLVGAVEIAYAAARQRFYEERGASAWVSRAEFATAQIYRVRRWPADPRARHILKSCLPHVSFFGLGRCAASAMTRRCRKRVRETIR